MPATGDETDACYGERAWWQWSLTGEVEQEDQRNMHLTTVKMKDGRTFQGPIWTWRPLEGYFTIPGDARAPEKIMFDDVESAVTENQRIRVDLIADQDELVRAREDGWVPLKEE